MDRETRRAYFAGKLTTHAEPEGGVRRIEGYFAVFNQETELWQSCFEQLAPGAFARSVKENDVRCLFNHSDGMVLGRTSAGTLELREDEKGLWGSVLINEADTQAMDVYARVQRGDISGCSFGFNCREGGENMVSDDAGAQHWTITDADVLEVTICTFPAYPQTEIEARQRVRESSNKASLARKRAALRKKLEELKC